MSRTGILKLERTAICVFALCILTACGGRKGQAEDAGDGEAAISGGSLAVLSDYGYIEAAEAPGGESPLYGIMHAMVTDIQGSISDPGTVYTLMDEADPENVWSLTGLELKYIDAEFSAGDMVCVFFNGDLIRDSENVSFLVIAPYGDYRLKRLEGTTVSNMMNSFSVSGGSGETVFVKDNCRMDERALSSESGDRVIVYYAEGSPANYPLRVFRGSGR